MSGFTDSFYEDKRQKMSQYLVEEKPHDVSTDETPPFWFTPSEVWEIRGADLTFSPVHHAAGDIAGDVVDDFDGELHQGISLRFPRFVRVREDKPITAATASNEILSLFLAQSQRQ